MEKFKRYRVGVIGCGMISDCYLGNLCDKSSHMFEIVEVAGCSDIIPERSREKAEKYGIKQMTNEEIFADPSIDIVLNITNHTSHFEVSSAALSAGKHVYSEKMLTVTLDEAKELGRLADKNGVLFCCAPDTFLGSGMQTARFAYDSGIIGKAVCGSAAVVRGYHHERFRTDPERRFAFRPGGGIMYDMGCYYLASLINLLGPIKRVCGFSQTRGASERVYANPNNPEYGGIMKIETPNNVCGTLEFECGALINIITTSESVNEKSDFVIYGTEGYMTLTDPNCFSGDTLIHTKTGDFVLPVNHAFTDNCRGLGLADMCYALMRGREPRASYERAIHMLEAGLAVMNSAESGRFHTMETTCTRPAPFAPGCTEFPEMVMNI